MIPGSAVRERGGETSKGAELTNGVSLSDLLLWAAGLVLPGDLLKNTQNTPWIVPPGAKEAETLIHHLLHLH